jgi:tight adherence protein C
MEISEFTPWIVFGVITVMLWALFNFFSSDKSRATERLEELRDPTLRSSDKAADRQATVNMLSKAAPALSKALEPKSDLEKDALKVRLANAGFNSPSAPQLFLATKVGLGLVCLLVGSAFGLLKWGMNMDGLTAMSIAGAVGFYGPEIWLFVVRRARMDSVFLSLPDALDLLVVCVEAGLGLDAAMRKVAEELADSAPDTCYEFSLCNMQLQMGRRRKEVLHDLGIRAGVDDMKALAAILIQAEKFGSSIAKALRTQSDSMRVRRTQMAEERAQKASVKMMIPMVLFIFPGVFVVLVGPAAIMMLENLLND